MAQTSYPYADDAVTEAEWLRMARLWREPGVVEGVDGQLEVTAVSGQMQVEVAAGQAWVDGIYYRSSSTETLNLESADNNDPRIDRVIVRSDRVAGEATLQVKTGTVAADPDPPTLTQDHDGSDIYELLLATIDVPAAASDVDGNVDDERRMSRVVGGVAFVTTAERDALDAYPGRVVFNTDENRLEVFNDAEDRWDAGGLRSVTFVADQTARDALEVWPGRVVFRDDEERFEVYDGDAQVWKVAGVDNHDHTEFVHSAGDTMTGDLTMSGNAVVGAAAGHSTSQTVSGATSIDLNGDYVTHELDGAVDYSTSNRAAGRNTVVRILPGSSARGLTVPSGWTWLGETPPAELSANTLYILSLTAFGPNESDVVAVLSEEA